MTVLAKLEPLRALASLLYPPACTICSASVAAGEYLCAECDAKITHIVPPFCAKCSEPFAGAISSAFTCANCAHRTLHFDAAVAAYRSRGIVRRVILDFKYGRQIHLRHLVGRWLCAALNDERLRDREFDVIVPVPLHPARERERGFNQAALIAEPLSAHMSIPARPVLERIRYTTTQTAFDRAERMENLRDAFRLRKNADVRELRVLLIDDVLTTGSTLSECARILKQRRRALRLRRDRGPRITMAIFKKPTIKSHGRKKRDIPHGLFQKCPGCGEVVHEIELRRICASARAAIIISRFRPRSGSTICSIRKVSWKWMPT